MQAWPGPNPLEMLMLMLLGGSVGTPTGVPPGPLDPLAAKVAPEECLLYVSWAETAEANANSENHTERLLAEPEIQAFMGRMRDKVTAAVADSGLPVDPQLITALQKKGGAVFLSDLRLRGNDLPDLKGGLLLQLGEHAVEVRRLLENLQDRPDLDVSTFEVDQRSFYRVRSASLPTIEWGLAGEYLLAGLGEGNLQPLLGRARTDAPAWLRELRTKLAVPRPAAVSYFNVAKVRELVSQQFPQADQVISVLGVDQVKSLTSVSGLSKSDYISRMLLTVEGQPSGLLAWLDAEPLRAADLESIPRGAPLAVTFKLDPGKAVDLWLDLAGQIEPNAAQQMAQGLAASEQQIGVKIREDLLEALGPTWRVFGQPGPSGLITGLTISVDVRDRDRVARAHEQLLRMAQAALTQPGAPTVRSREQEGRTVHSLSFAQPMPMAPAWCLTEDRLVIAITPQALRAALTPPATSVATHPTVKPLVSGNYGSLALVYLNTKVVLETLLPMVKMGLQLAAGQGQAPPGMLDTSGLPPIQVITQHLQPTIAAVRRRPEGIEFASRQTLPGGNMGAAAPVAVALLLPAVQSARGAARRTQGGNNLKQISIAMHNYHDQNRAFPPRFSADANGKPLLSWRVHLLPYVDQQALYEKFRLDEPWDSPHNRQLISQIPPVYQAPGAAVDPGKTNYLGNAGPDGIYITPQPGNKGTSMAEVRDGTSNTIMVVEASNEAAVIWTKPDDFTPDPANPIQGLVGLRPGGFQAAMTDGSVRFLPDMLDAATLRALLTRSGGEPVEIP